ncbi:MAG: GNAT family N-acetyltransferase, partial [Clostridia bacterium]|nr:GNAT family N-acetyltransferase [Clostridia bacterium]
MHFVSKCFDDLTTGELYEILKARSAVFVVEQNCVYQDIDGMDPASLHVFFEDEGRIAAYLRAFVKEPGVVHITHGFTLISAGELSDRTPRLLFRRGKTQKRVYVVPANHI